MHLHCGTGIMSQMKDLDARQELLVITMEECGELIQACSKALRRGELYAHSDSETELKQELADVQAMINLMVEWDVLSWTEIENGVERKRNKLARWSKLIDSAEETLRKGYAEGISMTAPSKSEQVSDEPYTQKVVYGHTPPYSSVNMTPLSEQEEREWERMYQAQESQKRGKETI